MPQDGEIFTRKYLNMKIYLAIVILLQFADCNFGAKLKFSPLFRSDFSDVSNLNKTVEIAFRDFIDKFNKSYIEGSEQYHYRLKVFAESLSRHHRLNDNRQGKEDAWFGINQFSDLTPSEFKQKFLSIVKPLDASSFVKLNKKVNMNKEKKVPNRVDWRHKKVVSSVKSQGQCGACWAFSIVETMESMVAISTKQLPSLSIQQLIDCAGFGNHGCAGGDLCLAVMWLNFTRTAIVTAKEYPLTLKTGSCKTVGKAGVQTSDYLCKTFVGVESGMLYLLAHHGPIATAVDSTLWQDYLGGIIQHHCDKYLNHAVQIVGYDLTGDVPYYIVRNSWGTEFGEGGYLRIKIYDNLCGIATSVVTLDVAG